MPASQGLSNQSLISLHTDSCFAEPAEQGPKPMTNRRIFATRVVGSAAVVAATLIGWFKRSAAAQGTQGMSQQAMIDTFKKHVDAELAGDLATTMATMSAVPHLNHVPTMAGDVGYDGVHNFYRDHLV